MNFVSKFLNKLRNSIIDGQIEQMRKNDPNHEKRKKELKEYEDKYKKFLKDRNKRLGLDD